MKALTVHGRTKEERPRHANRNHVIKQIAETISIPVIAKLVVLFLKLQKLNFHCFIFIFKFMVFLIYKLNVGSYKLFCCCYSSEVPSRTELPKGYAKLMFQNNNKINIAKILISRLVHYLDNSICLKIN